MTTALDQALLSPSQAGRRCGCSAQWIVRLTRTGILPCFETPLGRLIPAKAVERLAVEREARRLARPARAGADGPKAA